MLNNFLFEDQQRVAVLRRMIWLYFALLIFEGALRKWALPSLSAPLLVIRDPLVLLIYAQAIRCRRFPINGAMVAYFFLLGSFVLLAVVQIIAGIGGGPLVALFGLRTNFLHLPLIFVIPQALTYSDLLRLGKWILWLSIPMSALMVWQFMAPLDNWINAATSADAQQISFAMGKIRPAGTFSFITGSAHFFVLATAFLIYGLSERSSNYSRWLLSAALIAILAVQPVSGSRLLVLGCGLVVVAGALFAIVSPSRPLKIVGVIALVAIAFAGLSLTGFFQDASTIFMARWDNAGDGSAGATLASRIASGFLEPFSYIFDAGFLGKGIGLGTNAASMLMTGSVQFLLAEGEWARILLEAGPFLGFSFLAYRLWLAGDLALRAFSAARQQRLLAWLLAFDACRALANEQLSQPTNLGFMVFVSGLCLAAMPVARAGFAVQPFATFRPGHAPSLAFSSTTGLSPANPANFAKAAEHP